MAWSSSSRRWICAKRSYRSSTSCERRIPSATIQLQCPKLRGAWDRDRLEQVFSNLIGNALAHGDPDKPVTVTAGAEALRVWVEVHNEGPPIPQELQSALFNPFRMGERSSRSPAGLGLGLYISNEVIRRHGGQIEVRSTAVRRNDVSSRLAARGTSATPGTIPTGLQPRSNRVT